MTDVTIRIAVDSRKAEQGSDRVGKSLRKVENQTKKTSDTTQGYNTKLNELSKATRLVDGPLGGVAARFQTLNAILREGQFSVAAFTLGIAGLGFTLREVIRTTRAQEKAEVELQAALIQTGRVAEVNSKQFFDLAASLQEASIFGDELTISATAILARFENISSDVLPAAIKVTQDYAAATGKQLAPVAERIGRVLNDVGDSVERLRRFGVNLTDEQKELLQALDKTGNRAQAQAITVGLLADQYGNAAKAAKGTLNGALISLGNTFGDQFELSREQSQALVRAINTVEEAIPPLLETVKNLGNIFAQVFAARTFIRFGGAFTKNSRKIQDDVAGIKGAFQSLSGVLVGLVQGKALLGAVGLLSQFATRARLAAKSTLTFASATTVLSFASRGVAKSFLLFLAVTGQLDDAFGALTKTSKSTADELTRDFAKTAANIGTIPAAIDLALGEGLKVVKRGFGVIADDIGRLFVDNAEDGSEEAADTIVGRLEKLTEDINLLDIFGTNEDTALLDTVDRIRNSFGPETQEDAKSLNEEIQTLVDNLGDVDLSNLGFAETLQEIEQDFDKLGNDIEDTLSDAIADGLSSGFDNIDDLLDDVTDSIKRTLTGAVGDALVGSLRSGLQSASLAGSGGVQGIFGNLPGITQGNFVGPRTLSQASQLGAGSSLVSGLLNGFDTPLINAGLVTDISTGFGNIAGFGTQTVARGLGNFTPLGAISSFAGGQLADAFGLSGPNSGIGSTIGGIAGTFFGGPLGGGLGSFLGSALGGLFGSDPNLASSFGGTLSRSGTFRNEDMDIRNINMDTEFAEELGNITESLTSGLADLGVDLADTLISGGFDENAPSGGGFLGFGRSAIDPAFQGVTFDPDDQEDVNRALADYTVRLLDNAEALDDNVATALENIRDQGKTVEEILGDIEFAATFDDLFSGVVEIGVEATETERVLDQLNKVFEESIERAKELGLAEQQVINQREATVDFLSDEFDQSINDRIADIIDPDSAELRALERQFVEIRRDALALGADITAVEQLFNLERQQIIEQGLQDQRDAIANTYQDIVDDINDIRNDIRLDEELSGTNRLGRSREADKQLQDLISRVESGDETALEELDRVDELLRASLDYYGPTEGYLERLIDVEALLDSSEALAKDQVSIEQQILDEEQKQTVALNELLEKTSTNVVEAAGLSDRELLRPGENAGILDQVDALTGLSVRRTRQAKEATTGFEFETATGTFAEFVRSQGNTKQLANAFNSLIRAFGGIEQTNFFASGTGFGRATGLSVVGEEGPEIVNFGTSAQIFNNEQSRMLANGGMTRDVVDATRESMRAQLAGSEAIVGAINGLRNDFAELRDELRAGGAA